MNKNLRPQQNKKPPQDAQAMQVLAERTEFHGPLPHPRDLERYESIVPGAADRIISLAEQEASHRHKQEDNALQAQIAAQQRQQSLAEINSKAVFRSDAIGQLLGASVSFASIAGCIFLAVHSQPWVAVGLVGLPLAGIVRALRDNPKANDATKP